MRILIVGAGSTGGYFGGRLAEAGRDVTFLVRPGRAATLKRDGLRILSANGDVSLVPKLVTADAIAAPYDVVLLSVKAYSLDAAVADMAPAVGPETMIVPVLNGMRHIESLQARFGAERVVGGVCKIAAELDAEGRIVQMGTFQDLSYGELDGRTTQRIQALDAALRDAGASARLSPDIARELWEKWVMLASLGACCCLMRGHFGEINAAPGGTAFIHAVVDEVVAVHAACGHPPATAFLANLRKQLTAPDSRQTSSMYRDMVKGGAVEAEQIIGDLIARAGQAGIATPLLAAAFAALSMYQARLTAG